MKPSTRSRAIVLVIPVLLLMYGCGTTVDVVLTGRAALH